MSTRSRTLTYPRSLSYSRPSSCHRSLSSYPPLPSYRLPSQPRHHSSPRRTRRSAIAFRTSPLSFLSSHISAFFTFVNTPADPDNTSRFWTCLILVLSAFPSAFPYLLLSIFLSEFVTVLFSRPLVFRIWQYRHGQHPYEDINTEISLWVYQCLKSLAFGVELLLDVWLLT